MACFTASLFQFSRRMKAKVNRLGLDQVCDSNPYVFDLKACFTLTLIEIVCNADYGGLLCRRNSLHGRANRLAASKSNKNLQAH